MENIVKERPRVTDIISKILLSVMWVLLVVYCISLFILPIWMILTSFRDPIEYATNAFGFPTSLNFDNYKSVFDKLKISIDDYTEYNMFHMFGFSIIYSLGSSFVNVFLTTCMAYILSKYKFFGRNFIYNLGIVVMIVPIIGSLPSAMLVKDALRVYDNMLLHILTSPATCFSGAEARLSRFLGIMQRLYSLTAATIIRRFSRCICR